MEPLLIVTTFTFIFMLAAKKRQERLNSFHVNKVSVCNRSREIFFDDVEPLIMIIIIPFTLIFVFAIRLQPFFIRLQPFFEGLVPAVYAYRRGFRCINC